MDKDLATIPIADGDGGATPTPNPAGSIDDFFSDNGDIGDFVKQMQVPKEVIPEPPPVVDETGETIIPNSPEKPDDELEAQVASYLDYSQDQYKIAQFLLLQIDKGFAFAASLITGEQMERYQIRLKETASRKQEAELAAALVNKYQMRLSVEFMFLVAIGMAYAPICTLAYKDLKESKQKKIAKAAKKSKKKKDKAEQPL